MSAWTKGLNNASSSSASSSSSSSVASAPDTLHAGQIVPVALAAEYESLLTQLGEQVLQEQGDAMDIQQLLIDKLRGALESDSAVASTPTYRSTVHSHLVSLSYSIHESSNFRWTDEQYSAVLEALSWDVSELLLNQYWDEWCLICRESDQFAAASAAGSSDESHLRPIASSILTLISGLLEQFILHANAREVTLALLAFHERHCQIKLPVDEEDEEDEDEDEDEDAPRTKNGEAKQQITPFQRASLSMTILELLSKAIVKIKPSTSKPSASASPSTSVAPLSFRQIELYEQLLSVFNRSLADVSRMISRFDEDGGVVTAAIANERKMWEDMHLAFHVLAHPIIESILITLKQEHTKLAATTAFDPLSLVTSALATPFSRLRTSLLTFLLNQLSRFSILLYSKDGRIQNVLEGRNAVETSSDSTTDATATTPAATTLPVQVQRLLNLLFSLVASIDAIQPAVSPMEFLAFFQQRRDLETRIEGERMKRWEGEGEEDEIDESDEDDQTDGNKRDTEYFSDDEYGENAAVAEAKKQKQSSLIAQLRKQYGALPGYNVLGIGCYFSTVFLFQYFWHVKPQRMKELQQRIQQQSASATPLAPVTTSTRDPVLDAFIRSQPNIGHKFVESCTVLSSRLLVDSIAPYYCAILFYAIQNHQTELISKCMAVATTIWSIIPPNAIHLVKEKKEKSTSSTNSSNPEEKSTDVSLRISSLDDLDTSELEASGIWQLSETILQCLYMLPADLPTALLSSLRTSFLHAWHSLLTCMDMSTRLKLLQLSLNICSAPSIQAVILGKIKELIIEIWDAETAANAPSSSSSSSSSAAAPPSSSLVSLAPAVLHPDFLAFLHANLEQSLMDLTGHIDFIMTLINLFMYMQIRVKKEVLSGENAAKSHFQLLLPAVQQVWKQQWKSLQVLLRKEIADMDQSLSSNSSSSNAKPNTASDVTQTQQLQLLRNQLQLTLELSDRLLIQMS